MSPEDATSVQNPPENAACVQNLPENTQRIRILSENTRRLYNRLSLDSIFHLNKKSLVGSRSEQLPTRDPSKPTSQRHAQRAAHFACRPTLPHSDENSDKK